MSDLRGKVVVITGSGRGIGREHALAFADLGAHVIVNDLDSDVVDSVVGEISSGGGSAEANSDDISSWDGGQRIVEQAIANHGKLDVLVCNAGIVRDRMVWNMTEAEWDSVVLSHLKGHFVPIRTACAHWRETAKKTGVPANGRIITTSSEAGLYGHDGQANYAAAKAGVVGLTFGVAREMQRYGVTANAICPRGRSRMTDGAFGAVELKSGDFDLWDPANVAPWLTYLASDAAANITGQVFVVHGGTVSWLKGWTETANIEQDRRWTLEELDEAAAQLIPELSVVPEPFPVFIPTADATTTK
ncbi:SDR family NAD(P)-dependent oxidoreductase [Mycobacterium sp.]|uniref:SDR family NAD(P)-dependent oxidoreductase n=1 Tax=Mycobacterium sp. TaxID=1785 RepID=UPI003D0B5CD2